MKLKRIIIVIMGIVGIYGILAIVLHNCNIKNLWPFINKNIETKNKYEIIFNDEYPTHIMFWKNAVDLGENINTEKIDNINQLREKYCKDGYAYKFILIIDRDDEMLISEEEWSAIFETVDSGAELVYFGKKYLDKIWSKYNIQMSIEKDDKSVVLFHEYKAGMTPVLGDWTTGEEDAYKKDETILKNSLLDSMEYVISWNAKLKDYIVNNNA